MNFTNTPALASVGGEILARILDAGSGLVALESGDVPDLVEQLRVLARQTGQALYRWQADTGLVSLRDTHARIPDGHRLGNALRYMQQSMHFGVFFVLGVSLPLSNSDVAVLRQLARTPKEHMRRVVLVNAPVLLLEHLGDQVEHLQGIDSRRRRLRLRDGRWLA